MADGYLFKVGGRVQGVFFRESTRTVAKSLHLTGYAINLDNGSVEVLACGAADAIDELEAWLKEGPPLASVTSVIKETIQIEPPLDFQTG